MKRLMQCWLIGGLASVALGQAAPQLDPADMQMGEEYGAMAMRTLMRQNAPASIWSESQALAMAAQRVNPYEPRWPKLVARFATTANDTPAIIRADNDLRKLLPNDCGSQTQLIDIYLSQMETADQKESYLKSLVDRQSLQPEIRSYVAMKLARILLERSEIKTATAMVGQALNLNPLNIDALQMQYEIVQSRGSVLEQTVALLGMLRANPAQPDVIWTLARMLSKAGLHKESVQWYDLAAASMPRAGMPMPEELLVDYVSAIYLSGDPKTAEQLTDKILQSDPNTPQLWMVKLLIDKQQQDTHLDETLAKANTACFNVIQQLRQRSGTTEATTRPIDQPEPVTFPDLSEEMAKMQADSSGKMRTAFINAVANWAWLKIYYAHQPDDAQGMMQFLTKLLPADSPGMHRLQGWSALVKGDLDGAKTQFAAAPDDPLSQMGLIVIEQKQDAQSAAQQARKLLSDNSAGILGATMYSQLKGNGVDLIPGNESQAVLEQLNRFPAQYMSILNTPQAFYAIHVEPIKTSFQYDEPMLVRVSLQNLTNLSLTIGDNALIKPTVLFNAQQRGIGDQTFAGIAFAELSGGIVLHPGEEMGQVIRVDQGAFGLMLLNNPEIALQFALVAVTNPIPAKDRLFIGLGGYPAQMPRIIERNVTSLASETGRSRVMQMLSGDDGAQKIRAIVLLGNYAAQYLADPNAPAAAKKSGADLLGAIDQAGRAPQNSVQAMAAFVTARAHPSDARWAALEKMADDSDWQKQLLGAFGLQDAPADLQKRVDQKLAGDGHDEIVRKYANARLASLNQPATQP